MSVAQVAAERIKRLRMDIDLARSEVDAIAKTLISDFHFLDHRVSMFWECETSPVGMCVFLLDQYGRTTACRYCGDPEERK